MILRRESGRSVIDALIRDGKLARIPPNRQLADEYIAQATAHLTTSLSAGGNDPVGEFQLAYDAARKSMASILVNQGVRPTSSGGHIAVYDAVAAQLDPPLEHVFAPFRWMRPLRNDREYPSADRPVASRDDAAKGRTAARETVDTAATLLDQMPPYGR